MDRVRGGGREAACHVRDHKSGYEQALREMVVGKTNQ
jgi:hypothetical protein